MHMLHVLIVFVAAVPPAIAQNAPNMTCRETHATLKRTGNLYPEILWETNCNEGSAQATPPENNVLMEVCNAFSTADLAGEPLHFEMSEQEYRWLLSTTDQGKLPDGSPATTTQTWTIAINPVELSFTAQSQMLFVGADYESNEIAVSTGTCTNQGH